MNCDKIYYIVEKQKLDELVFLLADTQCLCSKLGKINDDLIALLQKSLVYEMSQVTDIINVNEENNKTLKEEPKMNIN